jgi:hypothetical protein
MISSSVKAALESKNYSSGKQLVRCYYCDRTGHRVKDCYKRKQNKDNKHQFKYSCVKNKCLNINKEVRGNIKRKLRDEEFVEIANKVDETKRDLYNLEKEFPMVFREDKKIVCCKLKKCKIPTVKGKISRIKGQPIYQAIIEDKEKQLDNLMAREVIRESTSPWRNPTRPILKPNGTIRLVSNLIGLNDLVKKNEYSLTNIRDVIRSTHGSVYFKILDLEDGFYIIEIQEEDKHKTAFEFNRTVYEWNAMVMGYKNSPQISQRIMDTIFRDIKGKGVEIYMDDIVIYAKTRKEHDRLCREVLKRLMENNIRLNKSKV